MCHNRECVNPKHMRLATTKQNAENVGLTIRNTSGAKGVKWVKRDGKWRVTVKHNYKEVHVGMFENFEEAKQSAIDTRNRLFTHNDADRIAS